MTVGDKIVVQVKDGIKDTNGKAVERFTSSTETYLLAEAPQFVSAKFVPGNGNPGKFQVTFDRPVTNVATTLVKIDGIALTDKTFARVGANTPGNYTYEVDVAAGTEFNTAKTVGTHEVVIFDVAETARNNAKVNSVINTTYTVNADVTAPVVQSVTAVNANKFFVEFSEAVTLDADLSKSITVKKGNLTFPTLNAGTVTSHGLTTANTFVSAPTTNSDGKHGVYVVVNDTNAVGTANPLYGANETSVNLDVTVENYKDGVDLLGTKYNGSVTLTKGTATPKATKSVVNSGSKALEVLFDSSLTAAPTAANLVVRDKDGVIIPTASVTPAPSLGNTIQGDVTIYTNRVVTIVLASAYQDKGPYTVTFKKDAVKYAVDSSTIAGYSIENNGNKEFDYVVGTAADNNFKYQVLAASSASVLSNVIAINYAVDMGNSARDVANYTLDGKALPAGTKVDFFGDKKTVHITLPKETVKATTDYKLTINTAVQTTTGQAIVKDLQSLSAYEQTIGLTDNTRPVLASAEYLVGSSNATTSNQVILKFSESLDSSLATSLAGTDFSVVVNGNTIAVTGLQNADQTDEYVILSLDTSVSVSQAATISIKTDVVNNENSEIIDTTSLPLAASSVTASNKTLDARGNGFVVATVNPTLAQVLQLGETTTGTLAGVSAATKEFTSSDTAVATVNPTTGAVSALTAGTTTINYVGKNAAGGIVETGSVVVTVHGAATTTNPSYAAVTTAGGAVTPTGLDPLATDKTFTINSTGTTGTATINASTGALTATGTGDIVVDYVGKDANGVVIEKGSVTVNVAS